MEKILAALSQLGLTAKLHEHHEYTSHDEHTNILKDQDGLVAKTSVLTDKKGRAYVCICHPDTVVSCKLLSSRLGVGKGGIKEAPAPLMNILCGSSPSITLASMLGCQYPFGVLLDQSLTVEFWIGAAHGAGSIYLDAVHVSQLLSDKNIQSIDFASDPKIDRDNPPDLKQFADTLEALPKELLDDAKTETPAPKKGRGAVTHETKNKISSKGTLTVMDVNTLATSLIQQISDACDKDEEVKRRTRADVIMQLNILRNASYSEGFKASKI